MRLLAYLLMMLCLAAAPTRAADWRFTTGGLLKHPGSEQISDSGNTTLESWFRAALPLHTRERATLSLILRGKITADSAGFTFNNSTTFGIGLAHRMKIAPKASLTLSLRHDWENRRRSGTHRAGWRALLGYFRYNHRRPPPGATFWGLPHRATITSSFANLTYPDSLRDGDSNLVLSGGIIHGARLTLPDTRWKLAPFLSLNASWDSDGNDFNNKLQPGFGIALRHPLPGGDIALGLRLRADYRWRSGNTRSGPSAFVSWFSAF